MSLDSRRLHSRRERFCVTSAYKTLTEMRERVLRLIRSLPLAHPFRAIVHVGRLPSAPFPPGTQFYVTSVYKTPTEMRERALRSIRSLPFAHPFGAIVHVGRLPSAPLIDSRPRSST